MDKDLTDLKERMRKMTEIHIEEYATRLDEIGGPGVGGTELKYSPFPKKGFLADTPEKERQLVLMDSIDRLWGEATWSYVFGLYRSCVLCLAILIERALKLELERRGVDAKDKALDYCIRLCQRHGILPNGDDVDVVMAVREINKRRNDVAHANIELKRPRSILHHTGPEHETEIVQDISKHLRRSEDGKVWLVGDGETMSFDLRKGSARYIRQYKKAASDTIKAAERVLKHLYPRE